MSLEFTLYLIAKVVTITINIDFDSQGDHNSHVKFDGQGSNDSHINFHNQDDYDSHDGFKRCVQIL